MLKITTTITMSGNSMVNDVSVQGYQATIDSGHPENMNIQNWINNQSLYKENRTQCRKDAAEFEEIAYAKQDEMIAALAAEQKSK